MSAADWDCQPLGAVADLCLGKMLDQNKNRGDPLPYLANINVRWGEFDLDNLRTMRFEHKEADRYGLKFGDIVMCEGGEPGRCAIWKTQVPGMMIQKALHRIRPRPLLDSGFLFYQFLHIGRQGKFDQFFTGATIKHLPGDKLAKVRVVVPPLPIQRRIASVLSAYDDLIENNRKRIAILEDMARRLYREWFVHFRYPGHESVPLVDSPLGQIPQGWDVRRLLDVAGVVYGFPFASQAFNTNGTGIPVVRIRDVLDGESKTFTAEKPEQKHYLNNGDILVGMDGDFHIGAWSGGVAVQNQRVARFIPAPGGFSRGLLLQAIRVPIETLNHQIVGATVGHLGDMHIRKINVIVPASILRVQAETRLDAMFDMTINLRCQSSILRRTRDLLLPRLMSGTLSVEALATTEAAVP